MKVQWTVGTRALEVRKQYSPGHVQILHRRILVLMLAPSKLGGKHLDRRKGEAA